MQVQISRFALTNIRELGASRADLAQALHSLQEGSLVFASEFPSKSDDLCVVTDRILSHVAGEYCIWAIEIRKSFQFTISFIHLYKVIQLSISSFQMNLNIYFVFLFLQLPIKHR